MRKWTIRLPQVPFFRDDIWYDDKDNRMSVLNICGHRRCGKSKGISLSINRDIKNFLSHTEIYRIRGDVDSENPVISYVAPTKVQARQIIWKYLLQDTRQFTGVKANNSMLNITIPRKHLGDEITVSLLASKNHDRTRGLKNFKIYLDEVQDAPADAIQSSIQPSLEDTYGQLCTTGTAKGEDHYYDHLVHYHNLGAPFFKFPITQTRIFTDKEIAEIRAKHHEDYFEREYMLNFRAPVEGAFYANIIKSLKQRPEFYMAVHNPSKTNILAMDIGVAKGFAAWLVQPDYEMNTINLIDYYEDYVLMGDLRKDLEADGYPPDLIMMPHDADTRQTAAYKQTTHRDIVQQVFPQVKIVANKKSVNKMADIANMGENLHMIRVPDRSTPSDCHKGLRKLMEFSRKTNPKTGHFTDEIDKSRGVDHAADALRTLYTGLRIKNGQFRNRYEIKIGDFRYREMYRGTQAQMPGNTGNAFAPAHPDRITEYIKTGVDYAPIAS